MAGKSLAHFSMPACGGVAEAAAVSADSAAEQGARGLRGRDGKDERGSSHHHAGVHNPRDCPQAEEKHDGGRNAPLARGALDGVAEKRGAPEGIGGDALNPGNATSPGSLGVIHRPAAKPCVSVACPLGPHPNGMQGTQVTQRQVQQSLPEHSPAREGEWILSFTSGIHANSQSKP